MPESDGPDVMSKNSEKALKEAKGVISLLAEFLEDADLKASARSWLEDWNVQDIDFRLEFRETLRGSIKRRPSSCIVFRTDRGQR